MNKETEIIEGNKCRVNSQLPILKVGYDFFYNNMGSRELTKGCVIDVVEKIRDDGKIFYEYLFINIWGSKEYIDEVCVTFLKPNNNG